MAYVRITEENIFVVPTKFLSWVNIKNGKYPVPGQIKNMQQK